MTLEEIDYLPAGRELDALVAQKVMGLSPCDAWKEDMDLGPRYWAEKLCGTWESPSSHECYPKDTKIQDLEGGLSYYSTSIEAAWGVVEKLSHLPFCLNMNTALRDDITPNTWCVWWGILPATYADTAPLAICKAALKMVC
jgi:hypothetical protein